METVESWFASFDSLSLGAVLSLVFFFAVTALLAIPRVLLIVTAGATFGIKVAPAILLGATIGGIIAFLLSRHIASGWFRRKLESRPTLRSVAQAVDQEGWRIIALVRLGAPIPNFLQGYAFGLTNIRLTTYVITTVFFSAPQIVLFTVLGATGRASLVGQSSVAVSILAVILAIVIIALLGWRVRKLLHSHLGADLGDNSRVRVAHPSDPSIDFKS